MENTFSREGIKLAKKRDPRAIAIFTRIISKVKDPTALAATYFLRGNAYYILKMYKFAVEDYTRAIKTRDSARLDPLSAHFHNRANAYLGLKHYREAKKDYTTAIKINSKFYESYLNRARARFKLGEAGHAKEDLEKALALNSSKKACLEVSKLADAIHQGELLKGMPSLKSFKLGLPGLVEFEFEMPAPLW